MTSDTPSTAMPSAVSTESLTDTPTPTGVPVVASSQAPDPHTVQLDTPILRGSQTISSITLRKPLSGELRGINLTDLLQLNVDAIIKVIPRIATPSVVEQDLRGLDIADFTAIATTMLDFFAQKSTRTESPQQ
jgi:hypothetical protein